MKKTLTFLIFILMISVVSATTITMEVPTGPSTAFDNQFIFDYDYNGATVTVEFDPVDDNFGAHIVATGLKPSFTYQVKIEGQGSLSADASTNELIGLNGRWWASGNQNDAFYWANKDTVDIIGYLVFDYFTTDSSGNFVGDVSSVKSYHVLFCDDDLSGNGDLYAISAEPAYSTETLKCDDTTLALCPWASVFGQLERPTFSGLPEGLYENVLLALNEESFHVNCGTWTTAMTKLIDFEIDFEANTCGNGILEPENNEACDDGNNNDYDGCSSICVIEASYTNIVDGSGLVIGAVTYPKCNPDGFSGEVNTFPVTTGIKNHQLKIEGKPSCIYPEGEADDWANEQVGLEGTFWCTNNCPCTFNPTWGGCNIYDNSLYEAHKDDPGFCAKGYVLFDCANSDTYGEIHTSFSVDSNYANCASYLGPITLPDGDYKLKFMVGQDYSPWGTVGTQDVGFKIGDCSQSGGDVPEFGTIGAMIALLGAGLVMYKKRK